MQTKIIIRASSILVLSTLAILCFRERNVAQPFQFTKIDNTTLTCAPALISSKVSDNAITQFTGMNFIFPSFYRVLWAKDVLKTGHSQDYDISLFLPRTSNSTSTLFTPTVYIDRDFDRREGWEVGPNLLQRVTKNYKKGNDRFVVIFEQRIVRESPFVVIRQRYMDTWGEKNEDGSIQYDMTNTFAEVDGLRYLILFPNRVTAIRTSLPDNGCARDAATRVLDQIAGSIEFPI